MHTRKESTSFPEAEADRPTTIKNPRTKVEKYFKMSFKTHFRTYNISNIKNIYDMTTVSTLETPAQKEYNEETTTAEVVSLGATTSSSNRSGLTTLPTSNIRQRGPVSTSRSNLHIFGGNIIRLNKRDFIYLRLLLQHFLTSSLFCVFVQNNNALSIFTV